MKTHMRAGLMACLLVVISWACQGPVVIDPGVISVTVLSSETPPATAQIPPTRTEAPPLPTATGTETPTTPIPPSPTPEQTASPYLPTGLTVIDPLTASNLDEITELPVPGAGVLAFSPDGRRLAAGLFDGGLVEILDLGTGERLFTLQEHRNSRILSFLSFSPDGYKLASASQGWDEQDDSVIFWDLDTGLATRTIAGSLGAVSPDWRTLVLTARQDPAGANLQILDLNNDDPLFELPARSDIYGITFSPDGNLAAGKMFTVYQDLFTFWDVINGREVRTLFDWMNFAFSPDGRLIAAVLDTGSDLDSGELTIFDASSWKNLKTLGQGADAFWYALPAFSPDGSLLAASFGDEIRLWDTETWALLTRIPMPAVVGLVFSPDGRLLAAYSQKHPVKLFGVPLD